MENTKQTTEPLLTDPAIVLANAAKAWRAVCDMETPVRDTENIGTAIQMVAADIEDQRQRAAIHWIADSLLDLSTKIEESRGEAFHALYDCQPTVGLRNNISLLSPEWRRQFDDLHDGQTFPVNDEAGFDAGFEALARLEDAILNGPIRGAPDALAVLRLWLTFYDGKVEPGTKARTVAEIEAEVLRVTAELNTRLEAAVRQAPGQWLWLHRRWKTSGPPAAARGE